MAQYYIISIIVTIISLMWAAINNNYGADAPYIIVGEFTTVFIIFAIQFTLHQMRMSKLRKDYYNSQPKTDPTFYSDRTD